MTTNLGNPEIELAKKLSQKQSDIPSHKFISEMDESAFKEKSYFNQKLYDLENTPVQER